MAHPIWLITAPWLVPLDLLLKHHRSSDIIWEGHLRAFGNQWSPSIMQKWQLVIPVRSFKDSFVPANYATWNRATSMDPDHLLQVQYPCTYKYISIMHSRKFKWCWHQMISSGWLHTYEYSGRFKWGTLFQILRSIPAFTRILGFKHHPEPHARRNLWPMNCFAVLVHGDNKFRRAWSVNKER